MSRIFWDAMLLIYLLEGNPSFKPRVESLLARSRRRGDSLFTSYMGLGEVLAGAGKSPDPRKTRTVQATLTEMGFSYIPFDSGAVLPFGRLRSQTRVKIADAIHLACAASAGIDLFLTGDKDLVKLDVPGIQFIADFNSPVF